MSDVTAPETAEALERHRAFVRETDKAFSTSYGVGGAAVLGAGAIVIVIGWLFGALGYAAVWVVAVTSSLGSLWVLRTYIRGRRHVLQERLQQYCEVNDLDPEQLRDYYANEGIYPYFLSLFGTEPRR